MSAVNEIFNLSGKRVLITGASSGLGRHFASVLAQAGATVIVGARRKDRLDEFVAELRAFGFSAESCELDVTNRESVSRCLDTIYEQVGGLDVVVNNAGVSNTKGVLEYDDQEWDAIVATNLKGAWLVAQEVARRMVKAGDRGNIVNVTSILANRVIGGVGPYCAAKSGLSHLTKSMALELARYQIRVNSLAPGYVMTEINRDVLGGELGDRLKKRIPTRRFCELDDLNGPLLLLVSDASLAMTGSEVVVDRGHSCASL